MHMLQDIRLFKKRVNLGLGVHHLKSWDTTSILRPFFFLDFSFESINVLRAEAEYCISLHLLHVTHFIELY
jgi:hypothetical protein